MDEQLPTRRAVFPDAAKLIYKSVHIDANRVYDLLGPVTRVNFPSGKMILMSFSSNRLSEFTLRGVSRVRTTAVVASFHLNDAGSIPSLLSNVRRNVPTGFKLAISSGTSSSPRNPSMRLIAPSVFETRDELDMLNAYITRDEPG